MGQVSIDDLKATAPELLQDVTDQALETLISQANLIAISDDFPDQATTSQGKVIPVLEMATKYMTLHLATTINSEQGQGITSEKVDVLEVHYSDVSDKGWLTSSPWGKLYLWLYRKYGGGTSSRLAVIQH